MPALIPTIQETINEFPGLAEPVYNFRHFPAKRVVSN